MQEKGITTTSVIIYVIIATIVIATFSVITTDFYETLKKENKQSMYSNKYTEFMSYFAKDIQEKNIIYMNFESAEWYNIKNYEDLYKRAY